MDREQAIKELSALAAEVEDAELRSPHHDLSGGISRRALTALATRLAAAIDRYARPGSAYKRDAGLATQSNPGQRVIVLGGVADALREDIASGYLTTFAELIRADVFADFLEMADELSTKGFKDPAAVVAGSVLEEHLRKLAQRNDIAFEDDEGKPLKAERINAELARAEVYNKLAQKDVTAWLALRNKAAHGDYEEYDHKQVAALITSVRDFLVRHPA